MKDPKKVLLLTIIPVALLTLALVFVKLGAIGGQPETKRVGSTEALYLSIGTVPQTPIPARSGGWLPRIPEVVEVPYSRFLSYTDKGAISDALVIFPRSEIRFIRQGSKKIYKTIVPPTAIDRLSSRLSKEGASLSVLDINPNQGGGLNWGALLAALFIAVMIIFIIRFFFLRNGDMTGRVNGDQKHASGSEVKDDSGVRFKDVAGCPEVVEEVSEFVDFLKDPVKFQRLGAKVPGGLLLYGPPGTGKTLVAKAMAGEASVPFFAVSGSEFVEKYVGVGASRVRNLFNKARKSEEGAVIFIDEIDAIGRPRDNGDMNAERDQTLNELLVQMDGFATSDRVVVICATNRKEVLDAALLRPGRLARQVRVAPPDKEGRLEILQLHAQGKPLAEDVDLDALAETSAGCSGADLADIINEAAIMAAREDEEKISQRHLVEGQLRALAGPTRRSSMTAEEKEMVAYHEAGHVLCAELCQEHEKAQRATIRPRGEAGGLALYGQEDRALHSTKYLHERLVCALGGRAAEWVQYGKVSSGAANDLQQANGIARMAVQELGFSPRAGQMIVSAGGQQVNVSDQTRQVVDREVERMVAEAYAEAVTLLNEHKGALDSLAISLLAQEDLDRLEIVAAIGLDNAPPRQSRPAPQMAPETVPVLHQKRAPKIRSRLRISGQGAYRRLSQAFRRSEKSRRRGKALDT